MKKKLIIIGLTLLAALPLSIAGVSSSKNCCMGPELPTENWVVGCYSTAAERDRIYEQTKRAHDFDMILDNRAYTNNITTPATYCFEVRYKRINQ